MKPSRRQRYFFNMHHCSIGVNDFNRDVGPRVQKLAGVRYRESGIETAPPKCEGNNPGAHGRRPDRVGHCRLGERALTDAGNFNVPHQRDPLVPGIANPYVTVNEGRRKGCYDGNFK